VERKEIIAHAIIDLVVLRADPSLDAVRNWFSEPPHALVGDLDDSGLPVGPSLPSSPREMAPVGVPKNGKSASSRPGEASPTDMSVFA